MKKTGKPLALAVGGAFMATLAVSAAQAGENNPFAMQPLIKGYMVADASDSGKMKEGKCSAGNCSASKKKAMQDKSMMGDKSKDDAVAAGSDKKLKEGSIRDDKK